VEATGLRWLAEAVGIGGVPAVEPVAVSETAIELRRLSATAPTAQAAEGFGRGLAATHAGGAARHGCPPGDWPHDGFIGPLPLPHHHAATDPWPWGRFFAELRIAPYVHSARDAGVLGAAEAGLLDRICARLLDGDEELTGPAEPPSRLHGDLWSGNVIWTPSGVVLIDPAAHGGHRESDLAMLALFGLPHLDRVLAGYHEQWPLADGWRHRQPLHQLFPLLVHAVLFGGGYAAQAVAAARRYA
jgi:fructosamine-3-kinase